MRESGSVADGIYMAFTFHGTSIKIWKLANFKGGLKGELCEGSKKSARVATARFHTTLRGHPSLGKLENMHAS